MTEIVIPNEWTPRPYQLDALRAFEAGKRRQVHIWHRRAGKDSFSLNLEAIQSQLEVGTYWHLFPEQAQARKAIWNGISKEGKRIIDQTFPEEIRTNTRDNEMQIVLKSGSIWQMAGSDRYNSLVGSNVKGVIFSEWALCNPTAWDYIRPILRENDGWAIFITTYRGKNHAYRMYERLKNNENWYCSKLTVDDTVDNDGNPILTPQDIEEERREGMSEGMIDQEYYCSPNAAHGGSYYSKIVLQQIAEGRHGTYAYNPQLPVYVAFDLGYSDHLAAVFVQPCNNEHNIIATRSWRFTTLGDAFADIRETFPFGNKIVKAILPPDTSAVHIEIPGVEIELARKAGVSEGIELVKNTLPMMNIDIGVRPWTEGEDENNSAFIDALNGYRTEVSKAHPDVYQKSPAHTWESHFADALRYYCVWVNDGGARTGWSYTPDYTKHDLGTI
jgi:hypothetical protein